MGTLGMADVLFVCTGNLCRSPSAALLLRQQLGDAGSEVMVHSAGTVKTDFGPPRPLVEEAPSSASIWAPTCPARWTPAWFRRRISSWA